MSKQTGKDRDIIAELLQDVIVPDLVEDNIESQSSRDNGFFEFQQSDISSFSAILVSNNPDIASRWIEDILAVGCPPSQIILELLSGCARLLGDKWCSDELSFADVTIGLAGLHSVLRGLDRHLEDELSDISSTTERAVLLTPMPGDTHIFGVAVLAAFFRNSGWQVKMELDPSVRSLNNDVENTSFDLIGVSVSCSHQIEICKPLIASLRKNSVNSSVKVMVGGKPFIENSELAGSIGADATANDAIDAVKTAKMICASSEADTAIFERV